MRIGELLALRCRSLDLNIGTLTVRESVFEGKMQPPKTLKARRTIPLGPHAITLMQEHRDRSARKGDDDLIFPNRHGAPMRESMVLRRVLQPAAERAGLGRVTWHQFRHIHSSLLNDLRVPVKIAQEQLGYRTALGQTDRSKNLKLRHYRHACKDRGTFEGLTQFGFLALPRMQVVAPKRKRCPSG